MRVRVLVLATLTTLAALPASAQLYITSITAAVPDPNSKVPAFNAVPGAGITTFSNGLAQAVLTGGNQYNYCVSLASATASGNAAVSFKIAKGTDIVQTGTIIKAKNFSVSNNSIWYYCSGLTTLPSSPGAAKLTASAVYTPTGGGPSQKVELSVPVLLQ
jgi:hypothetical protein